MFKYNCAKRTKYYDDVIRLHTQEGMGQKRISKIIPVSESTIKRWIHIVDAYGLKVRMRIRKPRTTDSTHGLPVFPNLIKEYIPLAPNRLWVSDITYITVWLDTEHYRFCYLSLILDAYTEEIAGWCVGDTLETEYPVKALGMALERIKDIAKEEVKLIHHSERGCQYARAKYVEITTSVWYQDQYDGMR